jgi:peptide/nickel transport system permease protein
MTDVTGTASIADAVKTISAASLIWRRLRSHPSGLAGLVVITLILLVVFVGPLIHNVDPRAMDIRARNVVTSMAHPLGTDNLGKDVLAQLMAGGRISLSVGLSAMLLSLVIGTLVGVLAGMSRMLDNPLMRLTDLFLSLPMLPLLMVVILLFRDPLRAAIGPEAGIFLLIVSVIGMTSWMHTARIVRGEVLSLRDREFILAARSSGLRERKIVVRHILPNILSSIMVSATLGVGSAIIAESALSFLGLGFPSDFPTWGRMLNDGAEFLRISPARAIWPGLAISLTVLSVNYLGDALRDALQPKSG